jgi:hypothetical protein
MHLRAVELNVVLLVLLCTLDHDNNMAIKANFNQYLNDYHIKLFDKLPVEMLLDQVDNDYMDKRVFYHDPCSSVMWDIVSQNYRSPSGGALQWDLDQILDVWQVCGVGLRG